METLEQHWVARTLQQFEEPLDHRATEGPSSSILLWVKEYGL